MIKLVTCPIKVNQKCSEHRTGHHYQDSSFHSRSSLYHNGKKLEREKWGLFKVDLAFSFSIPGSFQTWNSNKPGFEKLNSRSEPGFEKT